MNKKILLFYVFLLSACAGNKDKIATMEKQIDSLQSENARKDKDISDMADYVYEMADGLDSIAKHENMLFYTNKGSEGTVTDRNQLKKNLDMFENMLNHQRKRIAQLSDSLKHRGNQMDKLSHMVDYLNKQLDEKDAMIAQLRKDLEKKNVDIAQLHKRLTNLSESNTQLSQTIEGQIEALKTQSDMINEGYVKVGTKKELSNLGILSGGFLKKKKINPNAISKEHFMKVDIRAFNEIQINSDSPRILTQMPSNSYKFVKTGKNMSTLYILDVTQFWSMSNYLIIQL